MTWTVRCIVLLALGAFTPGCVSHRVGAPEVDLAAGPGSEFDVKLLMPRALVRRCSWSAPWRRRESPVGDAVMDLLASDPEADVLLRLGVTSTTSFFLLATRECVSVQADVARRIRTVALPSVGPHHHP